MYEVVLAVEDAERAATAAEAVADLPGEEIHTTVLHVFEDNPSGASAGQHVAVRAAVDALEAAGVEHSTWGDSGDPATVVTAVADQVDADMIALGPRERSPAGKAVFGSVTQSVIFSADRPVLVAPPGDDGE